MRYHAKTHNHKSAKFMTALILIAVMAFCGNFQIFSPEADPDINKHMRETFALAQLNAGEEEPTILNDFAAMALGLNDIQKQNTQDVFNGQMKEDTQEGGEEPVPEATAAPIEETQLSYQNTGGFIDWNQVQVRNHTEKSVDLLSLMKDYTPVSKNSNEPQILILHTHATEAYAEISESRTQDLEQNVVKVGEVLANALTEKGFNVLHDVKLHDYPNYNGSYKNSLATAEWYMEHYPSIQIILDVHRDAIMKEDGTKIAVTTTEGGMKAAQLMFVVGTNEGGLQHDNWQENLKFAVGLQQTINTMYPTLMRPVDLRVERFNQHVTPNTIIVETGSNGNSLQEAINSAELLANAIEAYIK